MICWNRLTICLIPEIKRNDRIPPKARNLNSIDNLERIQAALAKVTNSGTITVLPDYFVDRFVRIENFGELARAIEGKGREGGGGSIRGVRQSEVKGGNAVNLAYALGSLGVNANLITIANSLPAEMLRSTFRKLSKVNLDIIEGDPGFTVALEFKKGKRIVNVMVSDAGDLKDFDSSRIQDGHWRRIADSDYVGLVNWGSIKKGSELAESIFTFAKKSGTKTFFDPADVSEKAEESA